MENDELNATLKQVLDMTTFSQLLEMDEEQDRKISSILLYGFIERGKRTIDAIDQAK